MKKFPKLVVEEAKNLRKFATQEEKDRLLKNTIDPESPFSCIYGQLTSDCQSIRAIELIEKCTKRVYEYVSGKNNGLYTKVANCVKINGSPKGKIRMSHNHAYYSPIEVFISKNGEGSPLNIKLAEYIKGERKTLPS